MAAQKNKQLPKPFNKAFKQIRYLINNQEKVEDLNNCFSEEYRQFNSSHQTNCKCHDYKVCLESVVEAICALENGKCGDDDGINAEYLHHAPLNLLYRLTRLFNAMMNHSFVPSQYWLGHMIPVIKDPSGNHSDTSNYRGITISSIFTKVFEHVLKGLFSKFLTTSPLQFGFKKKNSTSHAIFCLKEVVNYYINNGSRVYCSFLDASKAFDRLVHSGLFIKMMNKGFPKIFIDVMISWYDGLYCRVLWDGIYSEWFLVSAGVRKGGVLSPDFYGLYVDDLIKLLEASGAGCHFVEKFTAALMYADDTVILAPSLKSLQRLLQICEQYCLDWDIKLNAQKTKNLYFGKGPAPVHQLILNGTPIDWVDCWKYLGVSLVQGPRFACSVDETLKKFYRAINSILRVDGKSDDMTMLRLTKSHCVSVLSYAIEVVHLDNRRQRSKIRVAYNLVFSKLFNYSWRESVTELQHALGCPMWLELVNNW